MRFLDLRLLRFGHFTDKVLNFAAGGADLHIIYGPNEAGKSTTLRAVRDLLFGIPERTNDGHRHELKDLRIGARLENSRGQQLALIRRKGRRDTLLDAAEQPLAETALSAFLGATTRALFETMFGLQHADLVRGGEELLAGRGELGESLFGASLGVAGVHALRIELTRQADDIFRPQGQKQTLNLALNHYKDAKKTLSACLLRPRAWQELQRQSEDLQTQLVELEQRDAGLATELTRLERLKRVLPVLQQRQTLAAQLATLRARGVRPLAEHAASHRLRAQERLQELADHEQHYRAERDRCAAERDRLQPPTTLLGQAAELEALATLLPVYERALADLPIVAASLATTQDDLRHLTRELGRAPDSSLDDMERWLIDAATQTRVRQLAQQDIHLGGELRAAQAGLAALDGQLAALHAQLARSPSARDLAPLRQVLGAIGKQGDLEQRWREAISQLAVSARQAADQLAALGGLWQGAWQQFTALPLPLAETVQRCGAEYQALHASRQRTHDLQAAQDAHLTDLEGRLSRLESQGEVPSAAELQRVRAARDAHWASLRADWLAGPPVADADDQHAAISAYEQHVRQADHAADRLWQDADRAARHAAWRAEHTRCQQERARLSVALAEFEAQQTALDARWRGLWQPCQIEPLTPAEMGSWLARADKLSAAIQHWRQQEALCETLRQQIADYRRRLQQLLTEASADASLDALLHAAQELNDAQQAQDNERRQLTRDLDRLLAEQTQLRQCRHRCEQDQAAWRQHWQQAVAPLGLPVTATSAEAEAVLGAVARLADKLKDARGYQTRIAQMQDYIQHFNDRTAALCRACAPDLAELPALAAARTLYQRWRQGEKDQQAHVNLTRELDRLEQTLANLRAEQGQARALLERLLADSQVTTLEELAAAEHAAAGLREAERQLALLDDQLSREELTLSELEAQASGPDAGPGVLPAALQTFSAERGELRQRLDHLREQRGQLRSQLDTMSGGSRAADAEADAQTALATIKLQVEEYVRIKLSERLLTRAIERYRARHQGPIIARASELFARLTLGGFCQLGSEFGADDRPELRCVRATGQSVAVAGLSEGTRDQLYLALRLASLEHHAAHNEPLPLVVDDILIHFDDARAQAALLILGELAAKTQILFFTHHARLLELAQAALPRNGLQVHQLEY